MSKIRMGIGCFLVLVACNKDEGNGLTDSGPSAGDVGMGLADGATDVGHGGDAGEDSGLVTDGGLEDATVADGALADAVVADAGESDAAMDAGALVDGGEEDGGETDGGASVDSGVSELEAALDVAWAACAAVCPQYPLCAPDSVSIEECESVCDADRVSFMSLADTRPEVALTCADAHTVLSECLSAASCEDFLEFFLTENPDSDPCAVEQAALTSACE